MKVPVKNSMTKDVLTVHLMDELPRAYETMKKNVIRHLAVLDDEGAVVGIISDRDFQKAMWPGQMKVEPGESSDVVFRSGAVVGDYMSWPVQKADHNSDLITIARSMIREKISAMIVTKGDQMVGIVTNEDLLRVLVMMLEKTPTSAKDKVLGWTYNSPIGQIISSLAEAGF